MATKLSWDLIGSYSDGLNDDDEDEEDETEVYKDTIQRLKDADEITRKMTREEYVHYSECRQASFTYRKAKRFREWANMATYVDMKPNDDIIDILGFLTFEMVNTLTDMGLAVKRGEEESTGKKKRTRCEPEREGKDKAVDHEEVGGSYCEESSEAQSPTKRQRAIKYESIFAQVPTSEMTTNSLFSAPPRERSPLQPFHLQEAFRTLQKQKQTAGNNFGGGLRRTKLGLI